MIFCCRADNDLYQAIGHPSRYDTPQQAIQQALPESAVLLLADGYPETQTAIPPASFELAKQKNLRLYIEYPAKIPGVELSKPRQAQWERAVIARDEFGDSLPRLMILSPHACYFIPTDAAAPLLVLTRVAGYDTAVYGLPRQSYPLLFELDESRWLIATTKLSSFVTARYAPAKRWQDLWNKLLARLLGPDGPALSVTASVTPAYGPDQPLPPNVDRLTFDRAAAWYHHSRLLVHPSREQSLHKLIRSGAATAEVPASNQPTGDGSCGILEGYASQINPDGGQLQRPSLRADCQAESAMVLALDWLINRNTSSRDIASNLLEYTFFKSNMHGGVRGDLHHPAYGLIAWGTISPAWEVANYGDDNARSILATALAGVCLNSNRYEASLHRALLANLRTTGTLGFRGDRIDIPALEANGWKHYHDAATINYAPHFESGLWACYLWAYKQTGEKEFLDKAVSGLRMTMAVYPQKWRWQDNIERARILLPLAWLVRVDDKADHRNWLHRIASDLLTAQAKCGAIQERIVGPGGGPLKIPESNEAYGTSETPLIQSNDDCASDQLYTTGFALLGLHEAAAATGDAALKSAEDKLAQYLCRIQVCSDKIPYLDGAWFRAFDFKKWDYWSSSADAGWGAWSAESGWGPAWTAAALALRSRRTTLWDQIATCQLRNAPGLESP